MPATSTAASESTPLTPEAQAAALWTFIEAKTPRFSFDDALGVIRELQPRPGEDPKTLAKRLRKALQARRVSLKHTHALHAASQVQGHSSWHTNDGAGAARLQFTSMETAGTGLPLRVVEASSWTELADELRAWADRLLARGELPLGVMAMHVTEHALNFSAPLPAQPSDQRQQPQTWPLGAVAPLLDKAGWLHGAQPALEKLRRHLEETGKAVLDGYAVMDLCARSHSRPGEVMAVTVADTSNSELVLHREDDEDDPRSGYEIARGDEVTCWHQLELSMRNDTTDTMPELEITVPQEGVGCWLVNGRRYVWVRETLKPKEYVPGRIEHFIGPGDCERLFRRYLLAKRIHVKTFKFHEQTKRLEYLGSPPEDYRVNLHFMLHRLNAVGLTWEGYCEKFGAEPLPAQDRLSVGFVFLFLQNLKVEDPNKVFAIPNLSEMARVDDDSLLRALMPRVETVRYGRPRDLEKDVEEKLRDAVDNFGTALRMQKFVGGGGMQMEKEMPYLLYANDATELCASVDELGLVMYAAVMPHLLSTKGLVPEVPGIEAWPWALGNAVFLRFERPGDQQ
jgi:hypothetical protein